jgi:hypothetical protein
MRHRRQQAQPAGRPAKATRHFGGRPSLVDEHQAFGIERRLTANEGAPRFGYVRAMLLGGVQALFLIVMASSARR